MSHLRWQIIDNLVERLKAAGTAAGQQVLTDPAAMLRLMDEDLPAILVRPDSEEPDEMVETGQPRRYWRSLVLVVEAAAMPTHDKALDLLMRELDLAIEQVVQADESQGGLALETILAQTKFTFEAEGGTPVGVVSQSYLVRYQF